MNDIAPWLALALSGVLHGLSPAGGWPLAAGCLLRQGPLQPRTLARRLLLPMAAGHAAGVLLLAALVAWDPANARMPLTTRLLWVLPPAAALVLALVRRRHVTGLALGSCIAAMLQGSGLMLVPALVPLCVGDGPARAITASGSVVLVLAAVLTHGMAMLATAGLLASGVRAALRHRAG